MSAVELNIGHTPNYASVTVGPVQLWFSYSTVIAFDAGNGRKVRVNSWGPTTGKHLNYLDGGDKVAKAARLDSDAFEAELATIMDRLTATLETAVVR